MTAKQSYMPNNHSFLATEIHGKSEISAHSSMSLWEATTEQKNPNWLGANYFFSQLKQIPDIDVVLCRDDGLVVLKQRPEK